MIEKTTVDRREHREHWLLAVEARRQSRLIARQDAELKSEDARLMQAMETISDIKDWTTG